MTITPKIFWSIFIIYLVARLTLSAPGYIGDTSTASRERALRYFKQEQIEKGEEYHRAGFGVSIVAMLLSQAFLALVVVGGISSWLAARTLAWSGGREWLQVILYLSIVIIVVTVLTLPFGYYQ